MTKYCVIGVGRFGYHVATTLANHGMQVLAVDAQESTINHIQNQVNQAICMRIIDAQGLESIGVADMDTVIVALGDNFAESVLITALLKQKIGVKRVITRAISQIHKDILALVGADQVLLPEQERGVALADSLALATGSLSSTQLAPGFAVIDLPAPKKFAGKRLKDLKLYHNHQVICIGHRFHEEIILSGDEYLVSEGDVLVIAGEYESLERIAKLG
jgi:trk system potassium uptake protein TrkA